MNRPPISERLYRALLVCYPAEFRQEYGPEMVELFSFRARQENRFLLWLQLLADIAVTAPREHFDVLLQDLRYTLRTLGRAPVFALTAILTLALGTGANTAIFSVVNAVMLRPLPFPQPDRLARIWETNQKLNIQAFSASVPNYVSWREQAKSFSAIGVFGVANLNLTGGGEPERLAAGTLTASMFQAIGLQPILGRGFLEEEERPGRGLVAVLNETLWRRRFESDPKIVGRSVEFNGTARVIVGVFPGEFSFPQGAEVWVPMTIDVARQDRGDHRISAVARLKPGVTLEQADAEMKAIANGLEKTYPQSNLGWSVRMTKFYDWIVPEQVRTTLAVLMGAVGLVLLIACANVANLLLARATSRDREIAMRIALGAGRSRLMRQLLTESTTLALMGGVVGILLAFWAVFGLKQILPASVPRRSEIGVDGLVLAFGLLLSIGTGALFGMAPMWHATRKDLNELLKQNGRTSTASSPVLRNALVVFEIAMVTVLAIGACLLVRSLIQLQQVQLGFNPQHVMTAQISLPPRKYPVAAALAFYQDLLDRLRGGGAAKAAVSSGVPLGAGDFTGTAVWTANEAAPPPNETVEVDWRKVSPEYFEAMGIPLLRGRFFTKQDANGRAVAIVSSQMARRLWGTDDAVGKELHAGGPERLAVVGVVGDVRLFGLSQEPSPVIYFPVPPSCWQTFTVV
ncbi:MAG TPA: ABC transporter permease, partial [Bryobacteraceae bacterium]|nr:ABC transporter permease [Bryobacteraceae bacterium]